MWSCRAVVFSKMATSRGKKIVAMLKNFNKPKTRDEECIKSPEINSTENIYILRKNRQTNYSDLSSDIETCTDTSFTSSIFSESSETSDSEPVKGKLKHTIKASNYEKNREESDRASNDRDQKKKDNLDTNLSIENGVKTTALNTLVEKISSSTESCKDTFVEETFCNATDLGGTTKNNTVYIEYESSICSNSKSSSYSNNSAEISLADTKIDGPSNLLDLSYKYKYITLSSDEECSNKINEPTVYYNTDSISNTSNNLIADNKNAEETVSVVPLHMENNKHFDDIFTNTKKSDSTIVDNKQKKVKIISNVLLDRINTKVTGTKHFNDNLINKEEVNENNYTAKTNCDRTIVNFGRITQDYSDNVELCSSVRPWTKKTACPYCNIRVTHFARHIIRSHRDEGAVKELSEIPLRDSRRKVLINTLRHQGNFLNSEESKVIRPVRRPKATSHLEQKTSDIGDEYIACPDCLGYFKKSYLRRHRKNCSLKPKIVDLKRQKHLSDAQLSYIRSKNVKFYDSLRLKDEVLKIMRADDIAKVAMNDVLICSYGESLLKRHKRVQIATTISNKMRELGRLLLSLQASTGTKRLIDVLKPEFFDSFVASTKQISGYNSKTKSFQAGSLALHLGTTLKQVCVVARRMILEKNRFLPVTNKEEALKDIDSLKGLIEGHWNSELSSLALKDLNERRWEKPKLLPLTTDVMKFQEFVMEEAKRSRSKIIEGENLKKEFRRLSECVLALTLLLNRKRISEVQFIKLSTYNNVVVRNDMEEILQTLTETEIILTKSFKHVITGGKGTKAVAVLFPQTTQDFINSLLKVRKACVSDSNEFLFANPSTANRWLSGYHVVKKLAAESGVQNQALFTSTRLRKQIATLLQVMNLTETEMEQVAAFMGHTKKTHEKYYRLPQDIFQTAKVSKLLLAINKGKFAQYKGKTLEEIEFSDNADSDSDEDTQLAKNKLLQQQQQAEQNGTPFYLDKADPKGTKIYKLRTKNNTCDFDSDWEDNQEYLDLDSDSTNKTNKRKKVGPKLNRTKFTENQRLVIRQFFKSHIENNKTPKKCEVQELINLNKVLFKSKNWIKIKAHVYNCIRNK